MFTGGTGTQLVGNTVRTSLKFTFLDSARCTFAKTQAANMYPKASIVCSGDTMFVKNIDGQNIFRIVQYIEGLGGTRQV